MNIKALCMAALMAAAAFGLARPAHADCKMVQVAELPLDAHWSGAVADGQINGQPIKVLIDTGSSLSMISHAAASKAGLAFRPLTGVTLYGVGGQRQAYGTTVKSFQVGQLVGANMNMIGSDSLTDPNISVILGNDILSQFDIEFDLPDHAVRLFKPESCTPDQLVYWNRPYSLAALLGTDRDAPSIRTMVVLNGQRINAELDSGAGVTVVDRVTASRVGATIDASLTAPAARGLGDAPRPVSIGRFKTFAFGDEQIGNVRIELISLLADLQTTDDQGDTRIPGSITGDAAAMMLIGDDFLRSHRVLVANREHAIVFSYLGGPVFTVTSTKPALSPPPAP